MRSSIIKNANSHFIPHPVPSSFHPTTQPQDLEWVFVNTFKATRYWGAVADREPYFMILRPSRTLLDYEKTTGLSRMEEPCARRAAKTGSDAAWLTLTDRDDLWPGAVLTVADPAWRAVLHLALSNKRGLDLIHLGVFHSNLNRVPESKLPITLQVVTSMNSGLLRTLQSGLGTLSFSAADRTRFSSNASQSDAHRAAIALRRQKTALERQRQLQPSLTLANLAGVLSVELQHFRTALNGFLYRPRLNGVSWFYMLFVQTTIVLSVMNTLVHSQVTRYDKGDWLSFYSIEVMCVSVFIFDMLLRVTACFSYAHLLYNFVIWIDLATIVPFFIDRAEMGVDHRHNPNLSILQVIRLIRILKLFRFTQGLMAVFIVTFRQAWLSLLTLFVYTFISVIVLGSALWYVEKGKLMKLDGIFRRPEGYLCPVPCPNATQLASQAPFLGIYEGCKGLDLPANITMIFTRETGPFKSDCEINYRQSTLQSIPGAMYLALVTLTTTGYGDVTLESGGAKLIAGVGALWALMVVALPVSVVAGRFNAVLKHYEAIFGRMTQLETLGIQVNYSIADEVREIDWEWQDRCVKIQLLRKLQMNELEPGSSDDEDQSLEDLHSRVVYRVSKLPVTINPEEVLGLPGEEAQSEGGGRLAPSSLGGGTAGGPPSRSVTATSSSRQISLSRTTTPQQASLLSILNAPSRMSRRATNPGP